jgi:hypothetical protein
LRHRITGDSLLLLQDTFITFLKLVESGTLRI